MSVEYRKIPRGEEKISTIGIGTSFLHLLPHDEIVKLTTHAFDSGINLVDFLSHRKGEVPGTGTVEGMIPVIRERREDIFLQMHFGVHFVDNQYTKARDVGITKNFIESDLEALKTNYIDAAFIANVDNDQDLEDVMAPGGVWDYMMELRKAGMIRHLGFSSHQVAMCNKLMDMGVFDLFMLSQSAADVFAPQEDGKLVFKKDRQDLFQRCQKEGVGITCMKPFLGGKLLDANMSPFGKALTPYQCLQFNLDRPGILANIPGISNMDQLNDLLGFYKASAEARDYSVIGNFQMENITDDSCIYCNHCQPCPAGIDIAAVNKYKDLAELGDTDALDHYKTLDAHAGDCIGCGQCIARCPFHLSPLEKMQQAKKYFGY